jgi:hypothetical protein
MDRIPLFFNSGGLVAGRGFIANVSIEGRCILERTGKDFVSFLGVNPGGVAGQGDTQSEAYHDFLENLRLVVFEFADEATNFEPFKALVEQFVLEANRPFEQAWHSAVADVRAGKIDRSNYPRVLDADRPASVSVELVAVQTPGETAPTRNLDPDLNPMDEEQPLVACGAG